MGRKTMMPRLSLRKTTMPRSRLRKETKDSRKITDRNRTMMLQLLVERPLAPSLQVSQRTFHQSNRQLIRRNPATSRTRTDQTVGLTGTTGWAADFAQANKSRILSMMAKLRGKKYAR